MRKLIQWIFHRRTHQIRKHLSDLVKREDMVIVGEDTIHERLADMRRQYHLAK